MEEHLERTQLLSYFLASTLLIIFANFECVGNPIFPNLSVCRSLIINIDRKKKKKKKKSICNENICILFISHQSLSGFITAKVA